ncbi:General secretion pathway protein GspF [Rubrivivax sp. A210]|uniref:type II secretion system F family protein n=1 Tax=Rubrivivax sp. A210 TaxID=2772301 RepID=UPI001919A592|nr:type II secretion system F family protein [Rubrivivax sp. A210]CAD5372850.1 General secretion pathway protein GspF [Rubrivivax sp. A210]
MTAQTAFRLRVVDGGGVRQVVDLAAADAAGAVRRAAQLGLVVLAIEPATAPAAKAGPGGSFSLLLFNQELLSLLEAGLNLTEALATLLAKEKQDGARRLLQALADELSRGRNFSDALAGHAEHFPPVFVAIVRAAERTGDLPRALSRFIAYQLQFDRVRKKLVTACLYPALLLAVGGAVTLFLLAYVVPRFASVYASAGREMPALSAGLLRLGSFIQGHALLLLAAVLLAAALAGWLLRRAGWGGALGLLLRLPGVAPRAAQFRLARFYRAVGLLVSAGVALPRALGMVDGLLAPAERQRLLRARALVDQGQPLTQALAAHGLASEVAASLLTVGERSGQLAEMLERTARFHDEDLERWLDWATRLIEPALMALIGVVVGGVVLLLYLPIFELAGGL